MMAGRLHDLLLPLLLLAPSTAVANIFPRQTAFSNSTVSSTPTKSASSGATTAPCCWIVAGGTALGLHKWYTSTAEHVVATVITTYIRENNGSAIAANSTTVYPTQGNTTWPSVGGYSFVGLASSTWPIVEIPGVPATLLNQDVGWNAGDYAATVVDNSTAVSFDYTDLVITQPTPFDEWFYIGVYTQTPDASQTLPTGLSAWPRESCGTWDYNTITEVAATTLTVGESKSTSYSTGSLVTSSMHVPSGKDRNFLAVSKFVGADIVKLNATYVQPKTEQVPDGKPWLPMPTGLKDWLATQEDVVEKYPYIKDCWLDQGNGQPSVHVPVNQLTVTSSHIIDVQKAPTTTSLPPPPTATPTQKTAHVEKTQTSLTPPQSPHTEKTQTSISPPESAHTEKTKTSLEGPGTLPDITSITPGAPRTENTQETLDAPRTKETSAPKAVVAKPESTIDVPEGSPATTNPSGTAVRVQTSEGSASNPTPGGNSGSDNHDDTDDGTQQSSPSNDESQPGNDKPDNNGDEQSSPGNDESQPGNNEPDDDGDKTASPGQDQGQQENEDQEGNGGQQGTQVQNTAQQTPGGVGGLISAIQSVATQQAEAAQNPQNSQNGAPNRPVAVITTNKPTASVTGFAIGSQTASPGGAAITQGGSTFSALPSGSGLQVVANGQTSTIANVAPPGIAVAQGSDSDDNYVVGDNTLSAGGAAITSEGTIYSALPSGSGVQIVADGTTQVVPVASPTSFQVAQFADSEIGYVVGQDTLSAGGAATTYDGATFSALPSGGGVLVISGGHTSTVAISEVTGSASVQPGPSEGEYIIAGTTLTAGGDIVTSAGTTYSALPSGGGVLVISDGQTSTVSLSEPTGSASVQSGPSEGEYIIAGTTLTAGGDALISAGTTYSALPSGSGLAIAAGETTSTASIGETISANTAGSDSILPTPVLFPASPDQLVTVGGSTYTARVTNGSLLVLGSQTVRPGETTVINGETLLLTGSNLVLATGTSTSTRGLGDAIMSGIGGGSTSDDDAGSGSDEGSETSESSAAEPTSGAGRSSLLLLSDMRVLVGGFVLFVFALI